jgi:hypothetical protein
MLIAQNKFTAYTYLDEISNQGNQEIKNEIIRLLTNIYNTNGKEVLYNMMNQNFIFTHFNDSLIAIEDFLDQPLCVLARELGFEVVLLTTMTGNSRIVAEVLDARSREESFDSVVII